MGFSGGNLPFALETMGRADVHARDRVIGHFPGSVDGIAMSRLAEVLRIGDIRVYFQGVLKNPKQMPDCVPIALVSGKRAEPTRLVLGISSTLADRTVNLTLGRERPPDDAVPFLNDPLLPGEKGALLFALDSAAGDWIGAKGAPFTIKGVLYDGQQIADYLRERPSWVVCGRVLGPRLSGTVWLWFGDPAPRPSRRRGGDLSDIAQGWRPVVRVVVGVAVLPVSEVAGLAPGDRVILDGWNHPAGSGGCHVGLLASGKWSRAGRWLDSRRIEVIGNKERVRKMATRNEKEALPVNLEAPEGDDAGEMTVAVTVEIGSFRTSVRDAAALVPGRVVSLDQAVGPEVTLKVEGKIIGRGRLVDLEGILAVEVKEVMV
jgi:flagellar motor switch/type III secretory pathway protein FliN